ncbi:chromate transporter [Bacillus sp. FSL K6-3431]|uniref:chromate transporter n=1 Tax=Bacillus sp. FSL K6-3431 TaxID=2921500 RepID=UPI0030F65703
MIYWHVFIAFFIPGILGYGGGPSSIPLIENEVVGKYDWLTVDEFSEVLAMGNALPGPIATKMAGYIGYQQAGIPGAVIALFATVAPSLLLMISLLGLLLRFKNSPQVKRMTQLVRPAIAVLLGMLTVNFFSSSISENSAGYFQTILISIVSIFLLQLRKVHPAYVIAGALLYGAIFL